MLSFPMHKDAVIFETMECCAMRGAYRNPLNEGFLKEFQKIMAGDLVDIFGSIFENTARLGFIPNPMLRRFYTGLACAEKEALSKIEDAFPDCRHKKSEHQAALNIVCRVLDSQTN